MNARSPRFHPLSAAVLSRVRVACLIAGIAGAASASGALGDPSRVQFAAVDGGFPLAEQGRVAPVLVSGRDFPGVWRVASDLQGDMERVTGVKPEVLRDEAEGHRAVVIVGTVGRSRVIDELVRTGKIDVSGIAGRWEAYLAEVVAAPLPGIDQALVIAGSDKRGTIYGVYDLSEQIGVSPWYWWADVPAAKHDTLFVQPGRTLEPGPAVRYRGIFLNDEAPDLTHWIVAKFGHAAVRKDPPVPAGIANYGREFYQRMFEVILRLRGNYLWPAMWNNAFNEDDPENARLADEYGVVMGTSHQEPMLRAQKEWDRRYQAKLGSWNYARHPEVLENFWREGIRRNRPFESIITIGLRGANDTPMAPGGPAANRALLEKIIDVQRRMLAEEVNPDVTQVPQLWCLYKEVQEFYEAGMRAPDDVTLLWAEDNWGNLRRVPTAAERQRPGGAGIYYHFDYHGGPRSYQWLNTSPLPKIAEQMSLAKQYGADRIWIVNVGHFKGYELPTEFFLRFAWNPTRWSHEHVAEFTHAWAAREFGPAQAAEIADIVSRYTKYNGRRKPEMLAPDTYSLVSYREAEKVGEGFDAIAQRAERILPQLAENQRAAFQQLVLWPTQASALINRLYLAAGRNALYAQQARASAGAQAAEVRALFQQYLAMVEFYHREMADGRWDHFMDQPVLGYTTWRDPPKNHLDHLYLREPAVPADAALGVAVEGSGAAWPGAAGQPSLPPFDVFARQEQFIDVFNRGRAPFEFSAQADQPWIVLSGTHGRLGADQRLRVSIDWTKAPTGQAQGRIAIRGAGREVNVRVTAHHPPEATRAAIHGFVESQGVVSVEAEHYGRRSDAGESRWTRIVDYGRTLSGMRADAPVDAPPATPGKDSPCLEYPMHLFSTGPIKVTVITAPTLNFLADRPVRYAIGFDGAEPQVVTLVPKGYNANHSNAAWEASVANNAHHGVSRHPIDRVGPHTLKIWMIDPAVVLQKIVVDLGGEKPSYLGPPESPRFP